jgi:hypothetical protein
MSTVFSQWPGRRERHLLRKRNNPLFPETEREISTQALQEAQRLDHEELVDFITEFRQLVHQAITLKPNEESQKILEMKERLDKAYEQACGLADDQTETKDAIKKLVTVIMNAVRKGAGNDQTALDELEQETIARDAHYALLGFPLVADILNPESPIKASELVPSLLSASSEEMKAAMTLFDEAQTSAIASQAGELISKTPDALEEARQRLDEIQSPIK